MANEFNSKVVLGDGTVLIDLTADTVDQAHVLNGRTFHDKSGAPKTGTCLFDANTSEDTATSDDMLNGRTAHARGILLTGSMPNNGAVSGTISTKAGKYTVPQGYHDGSGKVSISATEQAKIIPTNIREGVIILGVTGTMSGSEAEKKGVATVTPTFSSQVITPTGDLTCFSQVNVQPIAVVYADNSAGGKTVTIG